MEQYQSVNDYGVLKICVKCSADHYILHRLVYKAVKVTVYHGDKCIGRSDSISKWTDEKIEFRFNVNGPWPVYVYLVAGKFISTRLIFNIPMKLLHNSKAHVHKRIDYGIEFNASCELTKNSTGVPSLLRTYYNWQPANEVVLYNDASGSPSAWCDISRAVDNAQTFIYIAGWSIDVTQRLCRGSSDVQPLGIQLLAKANQGIQVLILLWDEPGSIVNTHDEEVYKFFNHKAGVRVLMARRATKMGRFPSKYFSHHQKIIAMDIPFLDHTIVRLPQKRTPRADASNQANVQTICIAFLGGLDITTGRYDTPVHTLWKENHTTFAGDFRQSCMVDATAIGGAPRLPWHDVHTQIKGLAAEDAIHTFRIRWDNEIKRQRRITDDNGLRTQNIMAEMLLFSRFPRGSLPNSNKIDATTTWNVHIVRSIDSSSVNFDDDIHPQNTAVKTAYGHTVDNSVHQAMIDAIRLADRFIYIEQQYFISSSQSWNKPSKVCTNIVALEIVSAICRAIDKKKPFHVYLIIPLHPDGIPESFTTTGVLYYQAQTISVIVREVNKHLQTNNNNGTIADYISVMTLVNQEPKNGAHYEFPTTSGTREELVSKTRRFMIYVHSKLLIVDDKIMVLGSANINQRSLSGSRDTEIAIYAYQTKKGTSHLDGRGDIYKFRRRLWDEHFSELDDRSIFRHPERGRCVRAVYKISHSNFILFASTFTSPLQGHAMIYPYTFGKTQVEAHRIMPYIPDCLNRVSFLGNPPRTKFMRRLLS